MWSLSFGRGRPRHSGRPAGHGRLGRGRHSRQGARSLFGIISGIMFGNVSLRIVPNLHVA